MNDGFSWLLGAMPSAALHAAGLTQTLRKDSLVTTIFAPTNEVSTQWVAGCAVVVLPGTQLLLCSCSGWCKCVCVACCLVQWQVALGAAGRTQTLRYESLVTTICAQMNEVSTPGWQAVASPAT